MYHQCVRIKSMLTVGKRTRLIEIVSGGHVIGLPVLHVTEVTCTLRGWA